MADFDPCFDKVMALEGGFKLHTVEGDRGGMTYAGIARKFWPQWPGWLKLDSGEQDAELTAMVRAFYKENFWDKIWGDDIGAQAVAYHLFAFAVNAGLKTSVRMAQRVVGATPDGVFGGKTFSRLNGFIQSPEEERIFITTFALFQIFRYKDICAKDRSQLKFLIGWVNRVQKGSEGWMY